MINRILFSLAVLTALATTANAQYTILSEDFQDPASFMSSCDFSYPQATNQWIAWRDVENTAHPTNLTPDGYVGYDKNGTQLLENHIWPNDWWIGMDNIWNSGEVDPIDTNFVLAATSFYEQTWMQANNILVTPPVFIPHGDVDLNWKSAPYWYPYFSDGYKVLVSPGAEAPNWWEWQSHNPVYIQSESTGYYPNSPAFQPSNGYVHGNNGTLSQYFYDCPTANVDKGALEPHQVDLGQYAGQWVRIAFCHTSTDDFVLTLDDIEVVANSGDNSCVDMNVANPFAICTSLYDPVCGCDGQTYSNACIAQNYGGIVSSTPGVCVPNFIDPPQSDTDECAVDCSPSDNIEWEPPVTYVSIFGDEALANYTIESYNLCNGGFGHDVQYYYEYYDEFQNPTTIYHTYQYRCEDTTPPVIVTPSESVVQQCWDDGIIWPNQPQAIDACGGANVTVFEESGEINSVCPEVYVNQITWHISDGCQNEITQVVTWSAEDNDPPEIMCPPNVMVENINQAPPSATGQATATDWCSDTSVSSSDGPISGNPPSFIRTWTATDGCNSISCPQTITQLQDFGCTNPSACNYDSEANTDDGSCDVPDPDCEECEGMSVVVIDDNNNGIADCDEVLGCTNDEACNFNPNANVNNGTCQIPDSDCEECEGMSVVDIDDNNNGIGDCDEVLGCTNDEACNFNPNANVNNGTCQIPDSDCEECEGMSVVDIDDNNNGIGDCDEVLGCTNDEACNFNPNANVNNGTCQIPDSDCEECEGMSVVDIDDNNNGIADCDEVLGCTNSAACNFNPSANVDNGNCNVPDLLCEECENGLVIDIDSNNNGIADCDEALGCTDSQACNFDPNANVDNGNCLFTGDSCDDGFDNTINDMIDVNCVCVGNAEPVAICRDTVVVILSSSNGVFSVSSDVFDDGSYDTEDEELNFSATQTLFNCTDLGFVNISLTVADMNGATDICSSTAHVVDNAEPTIDCPIEGEVIEIEGISEDVHYSQYPNYPEVGDNCTFGLVVDHTLELVEIGDDNEHIYNMIITATDVSGNQTICDVVVVDGMPVVSTAEYGGIDFDVYPNPNNGQFRLELSNRPELLEISLLDATGRLVMRTSNTQKTNFDLDVPAGLYFLRLTTIDGVGVRRLLIKR